MASDITYIRTHEGVLDLAVVIDLFSRRVIGWSMQGRTYTDLPLQALIPLVDCNAINCRATDGRLAAQTRQERKAVADHLRTAAEAARRLGNKALFKAKPLNYDKPQRFLRCLKQGDVAIAQ